MGTRNLTVVINKKKPVVAQYGQWDGYPSGQGMTCLNFLKGLDVKLFKYQLGKCKFATDDDYEVLKEYMFSLGCEDGWLTETQSHTYYQRYPTFNRSMGAEILEYIYESEITDDSEILIENYIDFAADSFYCEWAYVIDLDKGTFEVYKGFNETKLNKTDRFYKLKPIKNRKYFQVKLLKTYDIKDLPEPKEFIEDCDLEILKEKL